MLLDQAKRPSICLNYKNNGPVYLQKSSGLRRIASSERLSLCAFNPYWPTNLLRLLQYYYLVPLPNPLKIVHCQSP